VHGHECHSSLTPKGVNAIEYAAEVITHLRSMGRRLRRGGAVRPATTPWTTVHTGLVHGGTALNIVPKCRFDFGFRYLPTVDPEAL
jgi:acetylornithine deacetylase